VKKHREKARKMRDFVKTLIELMQKTIVFTRLNPAVVPPFQLFKSTPDQYAAARLMSKF
jgi:hypothetical protein